MFRKTGILLIAVFWTSWVWAEEAFRPLSAAGDEFTFIRIQFDSKNIDFGHFPWQFDYPAADFNFLRGVTRLTAIHIHQDPAVLRFDDEQIFEFPFLYMVEVGRHGGIDFTEKEANNLREYLLRGGFLFIDDFRGPHEWNVMYRALQEVLPEYPMLKLDASHPIFRIFYDIEGPQYVPGKWWLQGGLPMDEKTPENHAILDDEGRIMVLINWNSDIGDGWEHTYDLEYPTHYANLAYRLGINFLIYAMTH